MKRGGGKGKGSGFERLICKKLSLWVTHGKRDDILWRSSLSGGRATVSSKKGGAKMAHIAGDICAIDPLGHKFTSRFLVECKFYRDLKLHNLLLGDACPVERFWLIVCKKARELALAPMLIFKQNNSPIMVALDGVTVQQLQIRNKIQSIVYRPSIMHLVSLEVLCSKGVL